MRKDEVARGVRVKLVEGYRPGSLLESQFIEAESIFIREQHVFNDSTGEYVWCVSEDAVLSTAFYLKDLEVYYPYYKM